MAAITSAGIGSGIDLEGIITKLMASEQTPITQIQQKETRQTTTLSAWGQVKSALASLQSAAEALDSRGEFASYSSTIADSKIASVSVDSSAVVGNYSLEVTQLADAQKIKSAAYASSTAPVTSNSLPATLTLEIGTTSEINGSTIFTADSARTKTIEITADNNSLTGLRDAINASKSGVTASIVNDGGATPYHLVLSSDSTGSANSFKLAGLTDFNYDPAADSGKGTGTNISTITSAADAKFTVDGISMVKSSNSVTDAVQGMTLNLLSKTSVDSPTKINVATNSSAIQTKVSAFVSAYNSVNALMKSLTVYNTESKMSGVLNGDGTARGIQSQLKSVISAMVGNSATNRLAQIGLQFQKDGSLALDTSKFQTALADPTKDVAGLFAKDTTTGLTGVASKLSSTIADMLGTGGLLTARTDGINKTVKTMDKRIETLTARLASIETRYRTQFTAMDATIAKLNSTSTYLTQQLTALSNLSNYSSSNN